MLVHAYCETDEKKKVRIYTFKIPVSFSTFSLSLVDDIAVKTELQFSVV